MGGLFERFEFNDRAECDIDKVNGVTLPADYIELMRDHDGGEGDVGENAYIQIFRLSELQDINDEYQISEYIKDYFVWGTDLGGMLFGYSGGTGMYSAVDACSLCEDDLMCVSDSLCGFIGSFDRSLG